MYTYVETSWIKTTLNPQIVLAQLLFKAISNATADRQREKHGVGNLP